MTVKKSLLIIIFIFFCCSIPVYANTEIESLIPPGYNLKITNSSQVRTTRSLRYRINIKGYQFHGQGIISSSGGIYLEKIWLNAPEKYHYDIIGRKVDENERFTFENVFLSFEKGIVGQYIDHKGIGIYQESWLLNVKEIILDSQGLKTRGLIYLSRKFVLRPIWFSQRLEDFAVTQTLIREYDYYLKDMDKKIHIVESELEDGSIVVKKAMVNYTTLDNQQLELEIGNFVINQWGSIEVVRPDQYYSEHYQIEIGNVELEIPGVVPIFRSDGIRHSFELMPAVPGYDRNNKRLKRRVKVIGSSQEIILDNPYLLEKRQTGLINGIEFEAGPGQLEDGDICFDQLALVFPVTGEEGVLNLKNGILEERGFNFEEATIIDPFIKVANLGYIQVTGIDGKGDEGLLMDGKIIDLKEPIANILTHFPRMLSIKPFQVTEKGIDSISVEMPKEGISCESGLLIIDQVRWKEFDDNSFQFELVDPLFVTEDQLGTLVIPLGDCIAMDNDGQLWIQLEDRKVKFEEWLLF